MIREVKEAQFLSFFNLEAMEEVLLQYNKICETLNKEKHFFLEEANKPIKDQFKTSYIICLTTLLKRIFRIVLAYLNFRIHRIRKEYWATAGTLPRDHVELMSGTEKKFYEGYDLLVKSKP